MKNLFHNSDVSGKNALWYGKNNHTFDTFAQNGYAIQKWLSNEQ